jgi:hypothetical protein
MAADLLDRQPRQTAETPPTLTRSTRVLRVFAARNRSGAWAYLDEIGWRRVSASTPAESRDLLSTLCRARISGSELTVEVTGTSVLAARSDPADDRPTLLPAPRFSGVTRDQHRRPTTLLWRG